MAEQTSEYETSSSLHYEADEDPRFFMETLALYWMDKIFFAIVLVVMGITGNIISFILLARDRFKNSPSSFYMRALAVSDTGVLLSMLANHTMRLYEVPLNNPIYCQVVYFTSKWCLACSDWILAIMCLERCVAVSMPLKSRKFLKPKTNKIALAFVCICLAAYFSYVFFIYGSHDGICRAVSLAFNPNTRGLVDYCFFLIPASIILTSNIIIVVCILKSAKSKQNLMEDATKSDNATQMTLVIMLIAISVAFIVLKSPYYIVKMVLDKSVGAKLGYLFTKHSYAVDRLLLGISLILAYGNTAINFYLYVITGREYRQEMKKMLQAICRGERDRDGSLKGTEKTSIGTSKKDRLDVSGSSFKVEA